jgi:hypothetical protein
MPATIVSRNFTDIARQLSNGNIGVLGTMERKLRVRVFSGHNSSQKLSFRLSAAIEEAVNHETRVIYCLKSCNIFSMSNLRFDTLLNRFSVPLFPKPQNQEAGPSGSDSGGLLADLLEGARRRNLSPNSLVAYERTWRAFLAWAAASSLDPRGLPFPQALEIYRLLGKENGKGVLRRGDPRRSASHHLQVKAALALLSKLKASALIDALPDQFASRLGFAVQLCRSVLGTFL